MTLTKTFTQKNVATDCEGRYFEWVDTKENYEDVKNALNGFVDGVRVVEKTFDDETFEITIKVVKKAERKYDWDNREYKVVEVEE